MYRSMTSRLVRVVAVGAVPGFVVKVGDQGVVGVVVLTADVGSGREAADLGEALGQSRQVLVGREELRDERHLRHDGEGQNAAREGLGEDDQGVVALAPPFAYDWLGSKGRDTFSPIGPGITPAWFVGDPQDLAVRLWRNSELEQDGNTRNMIFSIPRLISAASAMMTLEPGDVIATGTPAGVGVAQGTSLADADFLRIEIDGLGVLENPVRVDPVVLRNHLMAATPRRVS